MRGMDQRNRDDAAEIEDPAGWDHECAEPFPGSEPPQAAVVVTFSGEDFIRVARQAELAGLKVTEFIREAALDKVVQRRLG
jgi:hypothetical protein